jgi:hypothetical protein
MREITMYKSESAANLALAKWLTEQDELNYTNRTEKAKRIMQLPKPYAFRLAALNAAGPENGKVWN